MFSFFGKKKAAPAAAPVYVLSHQRPDADAYGSAIALALLKGGKAWFAPADFATAPSTIKALLEKYGKLVKDYIQVGGDVPWDADVYVVDCGDPGRISAPAELLPAIGLNVLASYDHHCNATIGRGPQHGDKCAGSASAVVARHELTVDKVRKLDKKDQRITKIARAFLFAGHLGDTARFSVGNVAHAIAEAAVIGVLPDDAKTVSEAYSQISEGRAALYGRFWSSATYHPYAAGRSFAVSLLSQTDFEFCGAGRGDYAGMPAMLLDVAGVDVVAAVCQDTKDASVWRVAFRSRGAADGWAQRLAKQSNGDGHANAAGGMAPDEVKDADDARVWATALLLNNTQMWLAADRK